MLIRVQRFLAVLLLAGAAAACSRAADTAPPFAAPTVTLGKSAPAIGAPLDMAYRFVVAAAAPPVDQDYWVFVHFLDADGELMWTDDHQPPTPVRAWKPGSTVEYMRTIFIPKFPYVGRTRVEIGLFSPATGARLPLEGETDGQRAYPVASFDMRLEPDNYLVVFKDGWHDTEGAPEGGGRQWQWSMQTATLSFRNPARDVRVYLQADQPVRSVDAQRVEIRVGDAVVDAFGLPPGGADLRRFVIPADRLGTAETVDLTLSVDKPFVPALVPALKSADPRDLGIRVFRAFVEPS